MRVFDGLVRVLRKTSLLFKFKELSNFSAMVIAVRGKLVNGRISGLILKDSKGLAKISLERVHL